MATLADKATTSSAAAIAAAAATAAGPVSEPPPPAPAQVDKLANAAPRAPKQLNELEKRTTRLSFELSRRLEDVAQRIESGEVDKLDEASVRALVGAIAKNRDDLSASLEAIPTEDPLMMTAFRLVDEAAATIIRLEARERALEARSSTGAGQTTGTKEQIFQQADARAPLGYCAGDGAGDNEHCGLSPAKRTEYQRTVTNFVNVTYPAWIAAINAKRVDELIAKEKMSFEQKLGELLLGLMFQGFGAAAKFAVSAVSKKVVKGLTKETDSWLTPGLKEVDAPDSQTVAVVKGAVDLGAKKGIGALEKAATGHKTAKQVGDEAIVSAPADRKEFLQVMKSAPTTWATSILSNLNHLYDEDLAALVAGLPKKQPTQGDFEVSIDSLLKRFDEQVVAVNHAVRPVGILGKMGQVRHALVAAEQKIDPMLHGDARMSLVPTGKTQFIRWVDADMSEMAYDHHTAESGRTMREVYRFDDEGYWGADSLKTLASAEPAKPEVAPISGHKASS